jgi:hypothetical protein
MEDVLRNRDLLRITTGEEKEPIADEKEEKWLNNANKACGLIGMQVLNFTG